MLNEGLLKDIDLEAKAEAKKMTARVPIFRHGYEAGWYDSGEKYTALWQAAEEKAARYEKALMEIRKWELTTGSKIKVKHLDILKDIMEAVNKALTPKTGEDEN